MAELRRRKALCVQASSLTRRRPRSNVRVTKLKRENVEVIVHRKDGKIRVSDSYGHDPNPPIDRKL